MMNKKGFAISIILYSIILLMVTILFLLLAIMRSRYTVSSDLRDEVISSIVNSEGENSFNSFNTCMITGSSDNYATDLVLSIEVSNNAGILYSWDNKSFNKNNTQKVTHAGIYIGYFKDSKGGEGSCQIEIVSQTLYRYRDCALENILYGDWYLAASNNCVGDSKEEAEENNLDKYCDENGKMYQREKIGCNFTNEEYYINTVRPESSVIREIKAQTSYKIR